MTDSTGNVSNLEEVPPHVIDRCIAVYLYGEQPPPVTDQLIEEAEAKLETTNCAVESPKRAWCFLWPYDVRIWKPLRFCSSWVGFGRMIECLRYQQWAIENHEPSRFRATVVSKNDAGDKCGFRGESSSAGKALALAILAWKGVSFENMREEAHKSDESEKESRSRMGAEAIMDDIELRGGA